MLRQNSSFFWPGLSSLIPIVAIAIFGLTHLQACTSTNPLAAATDLDQRAYAVYGSFVIAEEQAAQLVHTPSIPVAAKIVIRRADTKAKPTADALVKALHDYNAAQAEVNHGGDQSLLTSAAANLTTWLTQAQTDITALIEAVKTPTP